MKYANELGISRRRPVNYEYKNKRQYKELFGRMKNVSSEKWAEQSPKNVVYSLLLLKINDFYANELLM